MSARMDVRGGALHYILFNRVLSRHEEITGAELFESRLFPRYLKSLNNWALIMLFQYKYCYRILK